MHSSGSGFSPLPKQSRAPPTLSHSRHPQAPRLVSQIYFGRFFRETEMKHLPPAPWFEVQGVPCFKSNGRSSSAITEARRPVLLSRDDPQGREARFSHNGETRPKVLPIGELSWLSTEWKSFVRLAWREASCASCQSASLHFYLHRRFSHESMSKRCE